MRNRRGMQAGWQPVEGSYEEAVLSWQEQIELTFRRRELLPRAGIQRERETRCVAHGPVCRAEPQERLRQAEPDWVTSDTD
jgi:hypothetical protein